jgi:hypothetical protein
MDDLLCEFVIETNENLRRIASCSCNSGGLLVILDIDRAPMSKATRPIGRTKRQS